jgi:hypothetical protein
MTDAPARITCGAIAGALGAACMSVIRMAARRHGIIDKTVPQAAEEWVAARTGAPRRQHPTLHHAVETGMHLGYGAALGAAYGLTVSGRSAGMAARGVSLGLATWVLGSAIVLPLLGVKSPAGRKRPFESAVDGLAHLVFGVATALVAEELTAQSDRGPSSDAHRLASRIG